MYGASTVEADELKHNSCDSLICEGCDVNVPEINDDGFCWGCEDEKKQQQQDRLLGEFEENWADKILDYKASENGIELRNCLMQIMSTEPVLESKKLDLIERIYSSIWAIAEEE